MHLPLKSTSEERDHENAHQSNEEHLLGHSEFAVEVEVEMEAGEMPHQVEALNLSSKDITNSVNAKRDELDEFGNDINSSDPHNEESTVVLVTEDRNSEETPLVTAEIEQSPRKLNYQLLEFHNESEFAVEVEVGTDYIHSGKIDESSKDFGYFTFGRQDIEANATSKLHKNVKPQDYNQSVEAVDLNLLNSLKRNGIEVFIQKDVTVTPQEAFYPLDVLADVATNALREEEYKKPARRGRSLKTDCEVVTKSYEKVTKKQSKRVNSPKTCKSHEEHEVSRKSPSTKKNLKQRVSDNVRVTRSSHLKNVSDNIESRIKPHDFLSVENLIPPANKCYVDRVVDINITSEEATIARLSLEQLDRDEIQRRGTDGKPLQTEEQFQEIGSSKKIDEAETIDIYDEDTIDENISFCYTSTLKVETVPIQTKKSDLEDEKQSRDLPAALVGHMSRNVLKKNSKPFKTKAERKSYNPELNPYISIERLDVTKDQLSERVLESVVSNIVDKPEENSTETKESVVDSEEKKNAELDDNLPLAKLTETSEHSTSAQIEEPTENGDFDEIPLAARIMDGSSKTDTPEKIVVKARKANKRFKKPKKYSKTKEVKDGKTSTKIKDKLDDKKQTENDKQENKNLIPDGQQSTTKADVSSSVGEITKSALSENSNVNYYTLPKLRRKSMSKDNLNKSAITTVAVPKNDKKDEDTKCMPPPKLREKIVQ
ncbi:hypothetical protein JTB14_015653 [Gonioctena quinquepunctata]|nr:hypothetical protein JTB14_015653 [Gonioctena quinquepunctata]